MKKSVRLGTSLVAALAAAACQDQATAPRLTPAAPRADLSAAPALPSIAPIGSASLDASTLTGDFAPGARAINPADYSCATTSVTTWVRGQVLALPAADRAILSYISTNLLALDVPFYEAALFQSTATPQSFGTRGEYTQIVAKTEKDLKRFWDIPSADIQFVPMHGRVLTDVPRVAATYQAVAGLPPASATTYATLLRDLVLQAPGLNGGDFPYLTFNAVAVRFNPGSGLADKVIVGDGVLAGFAAAGYADVTPQAVVAHEFAHHIQFRRGYNADPGAVKGTAAERTRYSELMADAYAAYFLTHSRGVSMNAKRVEEFLQVYFNIGDCGFTSAGHHGTPNQRMAAARFGFRVADEAQKQGHILTADEFHARFLTAYPSLIAPDAR